MGCLVGYPRNKHGEWGRGWVVVPTPWIAARILKLYYKHCCHGSPFSPAKIAIPGHIQARFSTQHGMFMRV